MFLPDHFSELADLEATKAKLQNPAFLKESQGMPFQEKQEATAMAMRRMRDFDGLDITLFECGEWFQWQGYICGDSTYLCENTFYDKI